MSMSIAIALHTVAAVIWVGGMFFAYLCLRPAVGALEPPQRCRLWREALGRFFAFVWASIAVLLATGYAMIFMHPGGMAAAGLHVHLMQGLGIVMMLLFMHVQFGPFRKLKLAVAAQDWPDAGKQVGRIRPVVAINLLLGLIVIAVATGGRWV